MIDRMKEVPIGFCHCGCGQKTNLVRQDSVKRGVIAGEPCKYVAGHQCRRSAEERFWEKVTKGERDECWLWEGAISNGYGMMKIGNKAIGAHRISYELAYGGLSDELDICHTCDVGLCVNPNHLFQGTTKDNIDDCLKKGRRVIFGRPYP